MMPYNPFVTPTTQAPPPMTKTPSPATTSTSTTSTTSTSTTSTTTAAVVLPGECSSYSILDDATRNINHGLEEYCDYYGKSYTSPDWDGDDKWYRFTGQAGVKMPKTP